MTDLRRINILLNIIRLKNHYAQLSKIAKKEDKMSREECGLHFLYKQGFYGLAAAIVVQAAKDYVRLIRAIDKGKTEISLNRTGRKCQKIPINKEIELIKKWYKYDSNTYIKNGTYIFDEFVKNRLGKKRYKALMKSDYFYK